MLVIPSALVAGTERDTRRIIKKEFVWRLFCKAHKLRCTCFAKNSNNLAVVPIYPRGAPRSQSQCCSECCSITIFTVGDFVAEIIVLFPLLGMATSCCIGTVTRGLAGGIVAQGLSSRDNRAARSANG